MLTPAAPIRYRADDCGRRLVLHFLGKPSYQLPPAGCHSQATCQQAHNLGHRIAVCNPSTTCSGNGIEALAEVCKRSGMPSPANIFVWLNKFPEFLEHTRGPRRFSARPRRWRTPLASARRSRRSGGGPLSERFVPNCGGTHHGGLRRDLMAEETSWQRLRLFA